MPGWLVSRLGYGKYGLIDSDNPDRAPTVTATVAAPNFDTFTRILQEQIKNTEEVRFDQPQTYNNTFEYIGIAPAGSLTSDFVWGIIRVSWVMNKKIRIQFQDNVAWDNRTQGWPN